MRDLFEVLVAIGFGVLGLLLLGTAVGLTLALVLWVIGTVKGDKNE